MKDIVFFSDFKNIHFIGIGGVSMSGLAKYCMTKGFSVSGSDKAASNETKKLAALGAKVFKGHKAENVKNAELVVYSSAVSDFWAKFYRCTVEPWRFRAATENRRLPQ